MYSQFNLRDLKLLEGSLQLYIDDKNAGIYHDIDFNPGYKKFRPIPLMDFYERIQYISLLFNMKGRGSDVVLIELKNQIHFKECNQENFLNSLKQLLR